MKISLTGMEQLAADVVASLSPLSNGAHVVALSGNLGAGKTTLSQNIAHVLGIAEQITSPTFVLMKQYELANQSFSQLIHVDAYRVESLDELTPLKFNELLANPRNLILIEWPEHIEQALPKVRTNVTLQVVDGDARDVTIVYAKEN